MYLQAAKWVGMNNQSLYAGFLNEESSKVWDSIINKQNQEFNFKEEVNPFNKEKKINNK